MRRHGWHELDEGRAGSSAALLVALLVSWPLAAAGGDASAVDTAARAAAESTAEHVAAPVECGEDAALFFWTARCDTATVHLLGSVHVGSEDFYPLDPVIEAAYEDSDVLAAELDLSDPKVALEAGYLLMEKATLPAGETLRDRVADETWDELKAYLAARQLSEATYDRMRPGAVAMFLAVQEVQRLGFDPRLGVDMHFLERARQDGRRIEALETPAEQIDALLADDVLTDELLLRESLAQMDTLATMLDEMLKAWRCGDADAIDRLVTEQMLDDPRLVAFHDRILVQRNRRMVERIRARLQPGEVWFVVVGAAHLVGEAGLPDLMREQGFAVDQAPPAATEAVPAATVGSEAP